MSPAVTIHLAAAAGAIALGPVALWARQGAQQRPRLHRAFGYAWVTLMVITALSALFIHESGLPNIAGYTPIHLLVPATFFGLYRAFAALARGDIRAHRANMERLYYGACVTAGAFALLPFRAFGHMVWVQTLGLSQGQAWVALGFVLTAVAAIWVRRAARVALRARPTRSLTTS